MITPPGKKFLETLNPTDPVCARYVSDLLKDENVLLGRSDLRYVVNVSFNQESPRHSACYLNGTRVGPMPVAPVRTRRVIARNFEFEIELTNMGIWIIWDRRQIRG